MPNVKIDNETYKMLIEKLGWFSPRGFKPTKQQISQLANEDLKRHLRGY